MKEIIKKENAKRSDAAIYNCNMISYTKLITIYNKIKDFNQRGKKNINESRKGKTSQK